MTDKPVVIAVDSEVTEDLQPSVVITVGDEFLGLPAPEAVELSRRVLVAAATASAVAQFTQFLTARGGSRDEALATMAAFHEWMRQQRTET